MYQRLVAEAIKARIKPMRLTQVLGWSGIIGWR